MVVKRELLFLYFVPSRYQEWNSLIFPNPGKWHPQYTFYTGCGEVYGGTPQNWICKNCIFILTHLHFSHPVSILLSIWCNTPTQMIFPLLRTVFELVNFDDFSCFTSSTWAKCFPLRTFSSRKQEKVTRGKIGWIQRVGHGGHAGFGQKLMNTQHSVGRCARKSLIMKWADALREFSKKFHWSQMQPLTTLSAGTLITDGFLEYSPSGEAYTTRGLPYRREFWFFGSPLCIPRVTDNIS